MQVATPKGEAYFLTYIDGHSSHVDVALLKLKSDSLKYIRDFTARAEVITGKKLNFFRSDSGGEYSSESFRAYLKSRGIHHEKNERLHAPGKRGGRTFQSDPHRARSLHAKRIKTPTVV